MNSEGSKREYAEKMKRKRLARNLRMIRKSLDMSEADLADKAGYKGSSFVVAIENESTEPSYEKLKDIANALDVTIPQLKGIGRKIETKEDGWPKISESERTALSLFAPVIEVLDDDELNDLINVTLMICKASGKVPKWKKPEYKKSEK